MQKNDEKSLKQMSEKSFTAWLLTVWNHITPNIYESTTNPWKILIFGVRIQLPVYVYCKTPPPPVLLQEILLDR